MGQRLSQRERFIAPLERLVRIAKLPQSPGGIGQTTYSGISPAIAEGERPMALRIIKRDRYFEMFPGGKEPTHEIRGRPPSHPRVYQSHWLVRAQGLTQQLFGNFRG